MPSYVNLEVIVKLKFHEGIFQPKPVKWHNLKYRHPFSWRHTKHPFNAETWEGGKWRIEFLAKLIVPTSSRLFVFVLCLSTSLSTYTCNCGKHNPHLLYLTRFYLNFTLGQICLSRGKFHCLQTAKNIRESVVKVKREWPNNIKAPPRIFWGVVLLLRYCWYCITIPQKISSHFFSSFLLVYRAIL